MIKKILIANRGEIACRIMRTCADMGIRSVAVYSSADRDALHTNMADEAVYIGPAPAAESYLVIEKIIQAALDTGVDAIHPGYGFLSENAEFAKAVAKAGLIFIGPPAKAITVMGEKSEAKARMEKAGVPLVPGYHGDNQDPTFLKGFARKIGYPVLIKASAGGGGKGMRVVETPDDFNAALEGAKREAKAAFGNDHVLIEKYLTQPRHVEVQVFGDTHGNYVYLFERDCSLQRRHQKVVEEAPAPHMPDSLRRKMGEAAVDAAKAVKYVGAGTVEFLLNADESFYFMEMNTRLQVEHPVTEEITDTDLVEWQIRVAGGQALPLSQDELEIEGHAIEVRLYAEDPDQGFLPAAGQVQYLSYPEENENLRIESALFESGDGPGDSVSIHYDPMIAKIVTYGESRDEALLYMTEALSQIRITGLKTNLNFLQNIIMHPAFHAAELTTRFIDSHISDLICAEAKPDKVAFDLAAIAAARYGVENRRVPEQPLTSPWDDTSGWRIQGLAPTSVKLEWSDESFVMDVLMHPGESYSVISNLEDDEEDTVLFYRFLPAQDSRTFDVEVEGAEMNVTIVCSDEDIHVLYNGLQRTFKWNNPLRNTRKLEGAAGQLTAPMPGKVVSVKVSPGDKVRKGAPLVILEAMKMEHTITAPQDGTIKAVNANQGDQVNEKLELVSFE